MISWLLPSRQLFSLLPSSNFYKIYVRLHPYPKKKVTYSFLLFHSLILLPPGCHSTCPLEANARRCWLTVLSRAKFGIMGVDLESLARHTAHVGERFCDNSQACYDMAIRIYGTNHFRDPCFTTLSTERMPAGVPKMGGDTEAILVPSTTLKFGAHNMSQHLRFKCGQHRTNEEQRENAHGARHLIFKCLQNLTDFIIRSRCCIPFPFPFLYTRWGLCERCLRVPSFAWNLRRNVRVNRFMTCDGFG